MGYKITTVTVSTDLDLEYHCSACRKKNNVQQTLSSSADEALAEQAWDEIENKLIQLQSVNPALRYQNAGFSCKCSHCGHREPWTWFRQDLIQKAYILWGALFLLSFILFPKSSITFIYACGWIFRILTVAAMAGTYYVSTHLSELLEPEIRKLPANSFPQITVSKTGEKVVPATQLPPDSWLCMQCGFMNPNSYPTCPCCHATQQWSASRKKQP